MSDRITLSVPASNVQTRAFRSHSYNPPPPLGSHRSRRTLSLPAREKPVIPPVITETPDCSQLPRDQHSAESCVRVQANCDEIGWFAPIIGLFLSLLLFAWACLLSLSEDEQKALLS